MRGLRALHEGAVLTLAAEQRPEDEAAPGGRPDANGHGCLSFGHFDQEAEQVAVAAPVLDILDGRQFDPLATRLVREDHIGPLPQLAPRTRDQHVLPRLRHRELPADRAIAVGIHELLSDRARGVRIGLAGVLGHVDAALVITEVVVEIVGVSTRIDRIAAGFAPVEEARRDDIDQLAEEVGADTLVDEVLRCAEGRCRHKQGEARWATDGRAAVGSHPHAVLPFWFLGTHRMDSTRNRHLLAGVGHPATLEQSGPRRRTGEQCAIGSRGVPVAGNRHPSCFGPHQQSAMRQRVPPVHPHAPYQSLPAPAPLRYHEKPVSCVRKGGQVARRRSGHRGAGSMDELCP